MLFEDMTFGPYDKAERKAKEAYELYEDGNMSQALEQLEEALQINPSNSAWHFNKALTLDSVNRFDDAISEYEAALELNPMDPEILNSLAVDYTRTGQYDLALSVFEHIQQIDPKFEPCYCNRIITYTEMDQHDLAEQMFYLAQQIEPDCALCYYNIGNSLFVRGQYQKAIGCWQKTAELEPTHPQINYRIAQAYWSAGQQDQAREYFLVGLRANPGDIDVILDFGLFLLEVGDIESAKEKFNRILELNPNFAPALLYLGEIAFGNSDYEQAVELYNRALQKDGALAGPRYRLAEHSLMKGLKDKARAYLASELQLALEDSDVLVSMASLFLTIGDLDLATHCLLKAVDADFAHANAYYYLGVATAAKGELEEACDFFSHALDIDPEHLLALEDSAAVYLTMGRFTEATERIKKAKTVDGDSRQLKALGRRVWRAEKARQITDFLGRLRPHYFFH